MIFSREQKLRKLQNQINALVESVQKKMVKDKRGTKITLAMIQNQLSSPI